MTLDAAFHRRVLRLFEDMLDQPPTTRDLWLEGICGDDAAIRDAVRALADADRAPRLLPTEPPGAGVLDMDDLVPDRIGQYRIIGELGRGGMGVVHLGERDDGLFEHKVAIKRMRRTLLGERALARFATERRILARLRHPHIAQILDGGVAPDGGPYIVMELIGGRPITDHARERGLTLAARLDLFAQVLDAIGHAHRNLIVHADIKPSNVVVEDGFGVKLLDFGVARLMDATEDTQHDGYTPGYASPARTEGLPATPADDVFAAGTLLGDLVEGQPGGDDDLRAIVAKATAPALAARYGAAGELLDDLARWQARRPTRAAPPGRKRRALLFWRRHRLGLSISAAAALGVLIALAVTAGLYVQSERRRLLAEQRYAASLRMADYIIGSADPALARLSGSLPVRKQLVVETGAYLRGLEAKSSATPALKREIAAGYLRLAQINGLDPSGGLGDLPAAKADLAHADRLIASAAAAAPDVPQLLYLRGKAKLLEGAEIFSAPRGDTARRSLEALARARSYLRAYLARVPDDIDGKLALWSAEVMPERDYSYLGRPDMGLAPIESGLAHATLAVRTVAQRRERDFVLNGSLLLLGEGYGAKDPRRALAYYGRLIDNVERMQREGNSDWQSNLTQASGLEERSEIEEELRDMSSAVRDARAAEARLRDLYRTEHNHEIGAFLSYSEAHLANLLLGLRRFPEARRTSDTSIRWFRQDVAADPRDGSRQRMLALALSARVAIEARAGSRPAACGAAREAASLWRSLTRQGAATPIDFGPEGPATKANLAVARNC